MDGGDQNAQVIACPQRLISPPEFECRCELLGRGTKHEAFAPLEQIASQIRQMPEQAFRLGQIALSGQQISLEQDCLHPIRRLQRRHLGQTARLRKIDLA